MVHIHPFNKHFEAKKDFCCLKSAESDGSEWALERLDTGEVFRADRRRFKRKFQRQKSWGQANGEREYRLPGLAE